jgi:hypothetical protein
MNKRRLLKLADLLEADAKDRKGIKFDLDTWGYTSKRSLAVNDGPIPAVSCETTACAMGLAALSGAFKREGLTYTVRDTPSFMQVDVKMGRAEGLDAAAKLFGITRTTAGWLFLDDNYDGSTTKAVGERAVAKRIRNFVAGKESPQ